MKKITLITAVMFLGLTQIQVSYASRNDDLAACSGVIVGNATYEISIGNEEHAKQAIKLAYTPYLEYVLSQHLSKEEVDFLDAITLSSSDSVTNRINSNSYGNEDYELYTKCLIQLGNLAIEVRDVGEKERKISKEITSQTTERIFRLIKAGQ